MEGDRETQYHYEPSGLLLAVDLPDGRRIDYAYDAKGQRSEKRVNGRLVEAFRWLDPLRLEEFFDGQRWWRLAYPKERTPVGVTDGDDAYFLLCDHLGTPLALVDLGGNVVQTMQYDAFGNLLATQGDAVRLPLGFAGGLIDADTGLTRFVWRDYDADTGRFTALDPMGAKGGDSDWYGYCVGDPVNRTDAWGLESEPSEEEPAGNGNEDPAKAAGKRIVQKGIVTATTDAWQGYRAARMVGAVTRGVLGLGTGMLMQTVLEYPPVQKALKDSWEWLDENYRPSNDGTMQD